jgi:hypothetical protein
MDWSIEERGADEVVVRVQALKGFKEEIKALVDLAAFNAGSYMKTHVPFHKGELYRAIFIHTSMGYKAGGAGGGGSYEATVGIDTSQAEHAEIVLEGSGIYNRDDPKNGIFPANGNVMVFAGTEGDKVFTRWTRGQTPQREWYDDAVELAARTIQSGLFGLDIEK